MVRPLFGRLPNAQNTRLHSRMLRRSCRNSVDSDPQKMEKQGISARGQRIRRSGHGQTKISQTGQGHVLRSQNAAQGQVYKRTSTWRRSWEKAKGRHALCQEVAAAAQGHRSRAAEGLRTTSRVFGRGPGKVRGKGAGGRFVRAPEHTSLWALREARLSQIMQTH